MRIAFVISTFPTLSETFILNQITGLIDRGHKVDIFASRPKYLDKVHGDVKKYKLLERCFYRLSMPKNKLWRVFKGLNLACINLRKNPKAILCSLNIFKYGRDAISFNLLFETLSFIGHEPYDVIHAHFGPSGLLAVKLQHTGAIQGKLITVFHGYDMSAIYQNEENKFYKPLFDSDCLLMPISGHWKNKLIEFGGDQHKIFVHHMGIDCSKICFQPRKLEKNDGVRLLTIARLVEKKGVEYGIRAVASVANTYQNIEYNIIGDGPLKDELKTLIGNLGMKDSIHLCGRKEQSEIFEYLTNASILLTPSVTAKNGDKEGIPVALMEAMA